MTFIFLDGLGSNGWPPQTNIIKSANRIAQIREFWKGVRKNDVTSTRVI